MNYEEQVRRLPETNSPLGTMVATAFNLPWPSKPVGGKMKAGGKGRGGRGQRGRGRGKRRGR